jgi:hypothetical protein
MPSSFPSVLFFFITDKNGDGIIITDAHDADGMKPSEIPSVIILPTVFVPYTDGMNPSAKLYNGVVYVFTVQIDGDSYPYQFAREC